MERINTESMTEAYSLVIVDDIANVVTALEWVLREKGYKVHSFTRAAPALEFIENHPVHLVISDFHMPEMNGLEFIQSLRASGWKGIFYFLSGHTSELKTLHLEKWGVSQRLQKPFDLSLLTESTCQSLEK